MKKIILSAAAVFAMTFANAQDKKEGLALGDMYLSSVFNFSSETTGDLKSDSFTVGSGLGYLLTENLAVEGSLSLVSASEGDAKASGFGIGAGVKYFLTPASKFSLSVGGNVSYASVKVDGGMIDGTFNEIGINVPVGLHYFVSDRVALSTTWGGLGYSTNDNGGNGADKTSGFELGLDMSSVNIGLGYRF